MRDTAIVGELRPSQILFTYGVGASVELPQMSTMVLGLDEWPRDHGLLVSEPRLLAAVRTKLGHQVAELRSPPREDATSLTAIGVPVAPFPEWLRCPVCKLLAPVSNGVFELVKDRYRAERTRYVHRCTSKGLPPTAYPARFLLACRHGHLDDFPWSEFLHRGQPCSGTLTLSEFGTGGGPVDVQIECGCGAKRRLGDAFGQKAEDNLPRRCRGRHAHLGTVDGCDQPVKTILLGASNSWFPISLSALSIPTRGDELDQRIAARWAVLEKIPSLDVLRYALDTDVQLAGLKEHTPEELFDAIEHRRSGAEDDPATDLRLPEWEVFSNPTGAPDTDDFRLRVVPSLARYAGIISEVVLAEKLREVIALTGFTRVEAPDDLGANGQQVAAAPMARQDPRWVPCTEVRGEGLFLRFDVDAWEQRFRWYVAASGIVFSGTWWMLLKSYRRLNAAKFSVIIEMEERLPRQLFGDEYRHYQQSGRKPVPAELPMSNVARRARLAAWTNKYRELGEVERVVPIVFALIYAAEIARQVAQ